MHTYTCMLYTTAASSDDALNTHCQGTCIVNALETAMHSIYATSGACKMNYCGNVRQLYVVSFC
jgi:hypothetical protein